MRVVESSGDSTHNDEEEKEEEEDDEPCVRPDSLTEQYLRKPTSGWLSNGWLGIQRVIY